MLNRTTSFLTQLVKRLLQHCKVVHDGFWSCCLGFLCTCLTCLEFTINCIFHYISRKCSKIPYNFFRHFVSVPVVFTTKCSHLVNNWNAMGFSKKGISTLVSKKFLFILFRIQETGSHCQVHNFVGLNRISFQAFHISWL